MSGMSDYSAQAVLNWLTGQVAMPARPSVWLALYTTQPTDGNTGGVEVSGGSYARVQVAGTGTTNGTTASGNATLHFASTPAWIVAGMSVTDTTSGSVIPAATTVLSTTGTTVVMSANATGSGVGNGDTICFSAFAPSSGSAPSSVANTNAVITFPQASASWGTVIAWGLLDASSAGNLIEWDYLGNYQWLPCTVSSASPGIITAHVHGYSNGDPFVFSTEYGGTAPTFSAGNFTGVLTAAGVSTDVLDVTGVNTSATGNGMVRKILQQSIPINVTASFAAGALTMTAA